MEDAEIVEKMHPNTVKRVKSLINNTSWVLDIKKHYLPLILWKNNVVNFGKDVVALISSKSSKF